jgi:hypothetical protein
MFCVAILSATSPPVSAESVFNKAKAKAKEQTEKLKGKQPKADSSAATTESDVASEKTESTQAAASAPPGTGVWLNYDFVPGDRTIWFEDFSGDEVRDFPAGLIS